jgi:hypothetical protein
VQRQRGRVTLPRLEVPARESRRHLREYAAGDVDADHVRAGVERELSEEPRAGSHIGHDHAGSDPRGFNRLPPHALAEERPPHAVPRSATLSKYSRVESM